MVKDIERAARQRADQIRQNIADARQYAEDAWRLLEIAKREGDHLTLGYATWAEYVNIELHMSRSNSYRLLDQAYVIRELEAASGVDSTRLARNISAREASKLKGKLPGVAETLRQRTKGKHQAAREVIAVEVVAEATNGPPKPTDLLSDQVAAICRDMAAITPLNFFLTATPTQRGVYLAHAAEVSRLRQEQKRMEEPLARPAPQTERRGRDQVQTFFKKGSK
jgi:hypothetical protein